MTDEQIEMALDIHKVFGNCQNCPYKDGEPVCSTRLLRDVSDYIERLKVENERLKERLQISPQGDDKIDELEDALSFVRKEKEQISKATAKEILREVLECCRIELHVAKVDKFDNEDNRYWDGKISGVMNIRADILNVAAKYDIEVEE